MKEKLSYAITSSCRTKRLQSQVRNLTSNPSNIWQKALKSHHSLNMPQARELFSDTVLTCRLANTKPFDKFAILEFYKLKDSTHFAGDHLVHGD